MKRLLVALLVCMLAALPAQADTVNLPLVGVLFFDRPVTWATVTYVWDGDTFGVDFDGDGVKDDRVRPLGIDTPEISFGVDCYGPEAKVRARESLLGSELR